MNEQVKSYFSQPLVALAGGAAVGIGAGLFGGYILAKRKFTAEIITVRDAWEGTQLQLDFERTENRDIIDKTIKEANEAVRNIQAMGAEVITNLGNLKPGDSPEIVIERIVQPTDDIVQKFSIQEPIGTNVVVDEDESGLTLSAELTEDGVAFVNSIFNGDDDDTWDYDEEFKGRTKEYPYIIHVDEYTSEEMGFEQTTLTYYAGDNILTDSHDRPIYDHVKTVGDLRFGHGSGDQNVVFVRNEKLEGEYEVLRDPGSYEEVVLGFQIEREFEDTDLKHSRSPRKFRED